MLYLLSLATVLNLIQITIGETSTYIVEGRGERMKGEEDEERGKEEKRGGR